VGKLSPFYLKREASACTNCAICSRACPMGLPVHKAETIKHADCVGCLDCVGECPREGALELKVGLPIVAK
jgi:polyferredoxin